MSYDDDCVAIASHVLSFAYIRGIRIRCSQAKTSPQRQQTKQMLSAVCSLFNSNVLKPFVIYRGTNHFNRFFDRVTCPAISRLLSRGVISLADDATLTHPMVVRRRRSPTRRGDGPKKATRRCVEGQQGKHRGKTTPKSEVITLKGKGIPPHSHSPLHSHPNSTHIN